MEENPLHPRGDGVCRGHRQQLLLDAPLLPRCGVRLQLHTEQRLADAEKAGGAIFDGFPRTLAQAEALDSMLANRDGAIDRVIRLRVDDEELFERVTRRFAESSRPDDNPESFKVRLDAYNRQTAPLLDYYQAGGKLTEVDGMASMDAVASAIDRALASGA